MSIAFIILAVVMLIYVATRKVDFFSVGIVCLLIYNCYCAIGYVFIASHEQAYVNYYEGTIDLRVYCIVLCQMLILFAAALWYDNNPSNEKRVPPILFKKNPKDITPVFIAVGVISMLIMIVNVFRIGISNLSAPKEEIWPKTGTMYVVGLWLAMGVFTFAIKKRNYKLLILSVPQVLLHLYFGSRAYLAVIAIVFILLLSNRQKGFSLKHNLVVILIGFILLMAIMAYKQIYELVKVGNIGAAFATLLDPDTYAWIFRWGEPRIVLADFNYIVSEGLTLNSQEILARVLSIVPFADDLLFPEANRLMSAILIDKLGSSYGLASNFWGELYSMGSYVLVGVIYALWVGMLNLGTKLLNSDNWTASFLIPLFAYFGFYVHRMDFTKVVGNVKMLVCAMIIWLITYVFINWGMPRIDGIFKKNFS